MYTPLVAIALLVSSAVAGPLERIHRRDIKAHVQDITIHESCSTAQRRMLNQAFREAYEVAAFAKDYVATNGPQDPIFKMYFGDKPEAASAVIGVWESVMSTNKDGVIFRCDDPDKNCHQDGWRGHWRGTNATAETVICDASYKDRVFNAAFCLNGFQLATTAPSTYWSIDIIHRLFHIPQITNNAVNHYADDLAQVLELAEHNSTFSPYDSDAQQYFAAHVYALEVAKGGEACIGEIGHDHAHAHEPAAAPSAASAAAPAATTGADCHTHADGTVHCGAH